MNTFSARKKKSQFGGGKRRKTLQTKVTKQYEYSASDASALKVSMSLDSGVLTITSIGRFVSLNFFKCRSWKDVKTIEDIIEETVRRAAESAFGNELPIRMEAFRTEISYNSRMDPENVCTMPKIYNDALCDQYATKGGIVVKEKGLPIMTWKGFFYADGPVYNKGTNILVDDSLQNDTYIMRYFPCELSKKKSADKGTVERQNAIMDRYEERRGQ